MNSTFVIIICIFNWLMDSDAIKFKYIECQKGFNHEGQQINMVCLNPECIYNPLCCCICVQELHSGHKTTSLKKLIKKGKQIKISLQKPGKQQVKKATNLSYLDYDIVHNIIESSKSQAFQKLQTSKQKISAGLKRIQQTYHSYFYKLELRTSFFCNQTNDKGVYQELQKLSHSNNLISAIPAIQKLLIMKQCLNQMQKYRGDLQHDLIVSRVQSQIQSVVKNIIQPVYQASKYLRSKSDQIILSTKYIQSILKLNDYKFSEQLKSSAIQITSLNKIISKAKNQYLMILMEPSIDSSKEDIVSFSFKITKQNFEWIAVGMAFKNIVKSWQFQFQIGHENGCYMVSTNGGTWSHTSQTMNNKLKGFKIRQGDKITCIVKKKSKQIFFIKENQLDQNRQIVSLIYQNIEGDTLHPCATFYYPEDEIQYEQSILYQCSDKIPRQQYFFSQQCKHAKTYLLDNERILKSTVNYQYMMALLNKSLEDGEHIKRFSFKIIQAMQGLSFCIFSKEQLEGIAIGMCHRKIAAKNDYTLRDKNHGVYMIASNGTCLSYLDYKLNKTNLPSLKFNSKDTIECEVHFDTDFNSENNKIIFRNSNKSCQLNFKRVKGDPLYPCVMVHNIFAQIMILPSF